NRISVLRDCKRENAARPRDGRPVGPFPNGGLCRNHPPSPPCHSCPASPGLSPSPAPLTKGACPCILILNCLTWSQNGNATQGSSVGGPGSERLHQAHPGGGIDRRPAGGLADGRELDREPVRRPGGALPPGADAPVRPGHEVVAQQRQHHPGPR